MARSAMDQQIEENIEQALAGAGRFLSGAPFNGEPRSPDGLPQWQHVLLRLLLLGWAGWAAWTWWGLHLHERVIQCSSIAAAVLLALVLVIAITGRPRRRHMRHLVAPLALALREVMPDWDQAQRLKAVKIPLDRSFVKINLPPGWHGQDGHKEMLRALVLARLGGQWEGEWNLKRYPFHVQFLPQKPKPTYELPDAVDFFSPEIQDAIAKCAPGQIVLGLDDHHRPFIKEMTGETAMWALSVGSGGGKSSFLQMVITQLVAQRATVIGVDVKMASIACFSNVEGIHLYTDPGNIGDMRAAIRWAAREVEARNYLKKQEPDKEFDRLTLILEEGNEFGDASKEWWTENKEKGDPAADPIWGDIASVMRMGRHVNVTIIGVFQDLREAAVGNRGLRNMFRLILMGNFNANQWKMIVNTSPVPESIDKAGRMLIVEGNRRVWIQVPYAHPDAFRDHCLELRQRGYSTADLYGSPPARSPQRLPSLLQDSRPLLTKTLMSGQDAGAPETALAGGVSAGGDVRCQDERQDERQDPKRGDSDTVALVGEPPADERIGLAEAVRRNILPLKLDALYQAKRRDTSFPVGRDEKNQTLYTEAELRKWYLEREARRSPKKADGDTG